MKTSKIPFGQTGWLVSPVGFGGYRIEENDPAHRAALRQALLLGCNVIDTSSNYTNGSSERAIGTVLNELFASSELTRDEVIVVSKAGYLQGENLKLAIEREEAGRPFAELVKYKKDLWHCMSPEFLADQITHSLERLRLDHLDVLLLHNPEYFLKSAVGDSHEEYYRRIHGAFAHLETEIASGRIRKYGVSSNTLVDPKESPEYTSFEILLEMKMPGFAVIQFPMNLFEPGALFEPNNSGKSVTELAHLHGIATLVNRPLNAFVGDRMIRLADFPDHGERDLEEDLKDAFLSVLDLESKYPARDLVPAREVCWGHALRNGFERLSELDLWRQVLRYQIQPALAEGYSRLIAEGGESEKWAAAHSTLLETLFKAQTRYLEARHAVDSNRIRKALEGRCPTLKQAGQSLSQDCIRIYRSTPGIDCVLVGMRQPEYVNDVMELLPPLSPAETMDAFDTGIEEAR